MGIFSDCEWLVQKLNLLCLTKDDRDLALKAMIGSDLLGDPNWNNVLRHCVLVAEVAEALCMEAQLDPSNVVLASIIHDAKKKIERRRAGELVEGGMPKDEAFTQAAEEQGKWLLDLGIPEEVVWMSGMTGHASLVHFICGDASQNAEIMFLADNLCGGQAGDEVVMWNDRMPLLKARYPWLMTGGTDILNGETYMEAQDRMTREVLDKLARAGGLETGEMLNRQLVEKFAAV